MRKLLLILTLLTSATFVFGQTYQKVGSSGLERALISGHYKYRWNLGSAGYYYPVDSQSIVPMDSVLKPTRNLYDIVNKSTARDNLGITTLLSGKAAKDSTFNINKNLADIVNASIARDNLGITSLLSLKANDNQVVHLAGVESITGVKTIQTFTNWTLPELGNREYLQKFSITGATGDMGFIGNSTSSSGSFVNVFGGYVQTRGDRGAISIMGLTRALADTNVSNIYQVGLIDNVAGISVSSDPLNGGLTSVSNRNLYTFRNGAQTTGTNPPVVTISASNWFSLNSFNGAFVPNKLTNAQRDAIPIGALQLAGLIYNTSTNEYQRWNGTSWLPIANSTSDIEIGNIGNGLILKSPDSTRYRITVANGGTLIVTAL